MKSVVPELRSKRLILRRPVPQDVDARLSLGQHEEIVEAYGGTFDPASSFTKAHAEAAIRFIEAQDHAWVIDAGGFIGHVRLHSFALADRRTALAIGIESPAYLGKGYGAEAIRLALAYAFEQGIHRVSVRVLASNIRAIACYRKCGFVEEGREREAAFIGGNWHDDLIMGILDRDFEVFRRSAMDRSGPWAAELADSSLKIFPPTAAPRSHPSSKTAAAAPGPASSVR